MPYAELNKVTLYYEEYGQGTPLLLLHAGWGLAVNDFAHQQGTLADEFRMIVPDRRGYGRSTRVEMLGADFHWQAADDMWALLDFACATGESDLHLGSQRRRSDRRDHGDYTADARARAGL